MRHFLKEWKIHKIIPGTKSGIVLQTFRVIYPGNRSAHIRFYIPGYPLNDQLLKLVLTSDGTQKHSTEKNMGLFHLISYFRAIERAQKTKSMIESRIIEVNKKAFSEGCKNLLANAPSYNVSERLINFTVLILLQISLTLRRDPS